MWGIDSKGFGRVAITLIVGCGLLVPSTSFAEDAIQSPKVSDQSAPSNGLGGFWDRGIETRRQYQWLFPWDRTRVGRPRGGRTKQDCSVHQTSTGFLIEAEDGKYST